MIITATNGIVYNSFTSDVYVLNTASITLTAGTLTAADLLIFDWEGGTTRPLEWFPNNVNDNFLEIGKFIRIGQESNLSCIRAFEGTDSVLRLNGSGIGAVIIGGDGGTGGLIVSDGAGINRITLLPGSIIDNTGAISFGDEQLSTTGRIGIGTTAHATSALYINDGTATPEIRIQSGVGVRSPQIVFAEDANDALILRYDGSGAGATGNYFRMDTFWTANAFVVRGDGNVQIPRDNAKISIGVGLTDLELQSNGTDGIITFGTSLRIGSATTNFTKVETDGFLEFNGTATAFRDKNIGAATLSGPPGLQPGIVNFVDENGADTGIATIGLAVGEGISGGIEFDHDYKEDSDFVFHIHWQGIAAPTGTDKVQFQLTYTIFRGTTTLNPATIITVETDFDTQYATRRSDFAAISGTDINIEDQFVFTLQRIAASADEYGGEALLATVGVHYELDTVGSRQITTK